MSTEFRCESCNELFPSTRLRFDRKSEQYLCTFKCYADYTRAPRVSRSTKARCEHCDREVDRKYMTEKNAEHLCVSCASKTGLCWFACAVVGNETKITKAIRDRFTADNVRTKLGKIVIPKVREAKRSKDRYEVLDLKGEPIQVTDWRSGKLGPAIISADSEEQALHEAVRSFDGREEAVTETKRVRKTIDKKRQTIDQTRIVGMRKVEVGSVRLVKQGGELKIGNTKAMPGYLLVQVENDHDLLMLLKQVKGIYSVLPFTEKADFEKYQKLEEEGEVPKPAVVNDEQVEKFAVNPKTLPVPTNVAIGDEVKIVSGMYASSERGYVVGIVGTNVVPLVRVRIVLMGRPVETNVSIADVRKV